MKGYTDYELEEENLLGKGKKLNAGTIKAYGKIEAEGPKRLTPLLKD